MRQYFFSFLIVISVGIVNNLAYSANKPYLYQVTYPVEHGEGPHWSERHNSLYFVDLHAGKILNYNPSTDKTTTLQLNGDVSIVIPTKNYPNLFVAAVNRSLVTLQLNNEGALEKQIVLTTVANDKPTSRFNDGKADSNGRLWFGTMGFENASGVVPEQGSLYLFNLKKSNNPQIKITPVTVSNGLTWNKDDDKFFYIDSPSRQIKMYNYNSTDATITNEVVLFDLKQHPELGGVPDGMTIDEDDNLWIALYDGGCVIKVNSKTGKLLQIIAIPAQYVTSVAWGGPLLDTLYVTTSRFNLNNDDRLRQPAAGSLFAIEHLGTRGLQMYEANLIEHIQK